MTGGSGIQNSDHFDHRSFSANHGKGAKIGACIVAKELVLELQVLAIYVPFILPQRLGKQLCNRVPGKRRALCSLVAWTART